MQQGLFNSDSKSSSQSPLANKSRPTSKSNYIGFEKLSGRYPFLAAAHFPSTIIWGPPGTGKTTLARVLSENSEKEFLTFSAVLSGIADLKKLIAQSQETKQLYNRESVIFIDEIHRFNKAQQDALLPHVEAGTFTLIGATTENPRSSINRALLSRMQIVELKTHTHENLLSIVNSVISKEEMEFEITFHEGTAVGVSPPNFVDLEVTYAEDAIKGDTVGTAKKKVTVETGGEVLVPLYVKQGDFIKVDLRDLSFVERVSK